MAPRHPHAIEAVRLAALMPRVPRAYITKRLNQPGACPRPLYVLACVLQAARHYEQTRPACLGNTVN